MAQGPHKKTKCDENRTPPFGPSLAQKTTQALKKGLLTARTIGEGKRYALKSSHGAEGRANIRDPKNAA